ncbi:MAG: hemerythrin domain-containing protein [Candidatus Nanoarchaeia archaeon]|nr:hemerythrin domain-containing protein [Candidatus Nanoarchaeia archaeon]
MDANEILLYEHKIIYSLLDKLNIKIKEIEKLKSISGNFIDLFTDFFITYIDVYHHGKEENLMFERLKKKPLSTYDKKSIELLENQHNLGRKIIEKIIVSSANYFAIKNDQNFKKLIILLKEFHKLYTEHAYFEDNSFFKEIINYFTASEKEQLTQDFFKFNIRMVDEKYKSLLDLI